MLDHAINRAMISPNEAWRIYFRFAIWIAFTTYTYTEKKGDEQARLISNPWVEEPGRVRVNFQSVLVFQIKDGFERCIEETSCS